MNQQSIWMSIMETTVNWLFYFSLRQISGCQIKLPVFPLKVHLYDHVIFKIIIYDVLVVSSSPLVLFIRGLCCSIFNFLCTDLQIIECLTLYPLPFFCWPLYMYCLSVFNLRLVITLGDLQTFLCYAFHHAVIQNIFAYIGTLTKRNENRKICAVKKKHCLFSKRK